MSLIPLQSLMDLRDKRLGFKPPDIASFILSTLDDEEVFYKGKAAADRKWGLAVPINVAKKQHGLWALTLLYKKSRSRSAYLAFERALRLLFDDLQAGKLQYASQPICKDLLAKLIDFAYAIEFQYGIDVVREMVDAGKLKISAKLIH